ncbi:hypothetical protein MMC18_007421 [Xylographa bjoerkii]|nr:hypothetical protein [Xylographa bjoerkii]MCJ1394542.1 hypothetical protein [Xylographa bjoerkii]
MQPLRHIPPQFLLPAWNYGQLTQLRWFHDFSGLLNPQEEDSHRGERNSGTPSFRKQYNFDSASALRPCKTRSTTESIHLVRDKRENARRENQIQGDVRKEPVAHAARQSNNGGKYVRYIAQDDSQEAAIAYVSNKQQPNNAFGPRPSTYHLRLKNVSGPPLSGATNTDTETSNNGSGRPDPVASTYSHLRTAGNVTSPELELDTIPKSEMMRGHTKDQLEIDYKPWGWMSLPSISGKSREDHRFYQDASTELRSQPKYAADRSLERRRMATNVGDQKFRRSDIQPLRTSSERLGVGERETDRVMQPVKQPSGTYNAVESQIPSRRESTLRPQSNTSQSRSETSRTEDINQHTPQRRLRFRDKTNLGAPPPAEEVIPMPIPKELTLLEQLFPEEVKTQSRASELGGKAQEELPRLPPPEFDGLRESSEDDPGYIQLSSKLKTREATINAFRQENTTILLLSRVSTALCDADFRRIVPRGIHIEEWRGPGDILKVIPSRDMSSLSPTSNYYLLFSNPAYARAYQNQVIYLHQLAQTYTPTSLDFPMPPAPGVLDTKGQDVYALLQDFTISPPSVRMSLRVSIPPYHANLQRLLEIGGYPQLVQPENRAGRAVLFWVDGYQPSALSIRTMLAKDGQDRGLQWGPLRGNGEIEVLHVHAEGNGDENGENDMTASDDEPGLSAWRDIELKPKRHGHQRWIISFEDEAEARRFVRVWHRRPYPFPLQGESPPQGEPHPLVHVEFMW